MNGHDFRSSQSSYGEPRYPSYEPQPPPPPAQILLDGYRDVLDPQNGGKSRYNPLNPTHPRSSALLNANDPVVMYLLSETAIGDSKNYEVLSLEEVEELKKEHSFLAGRLDASKKKLALEMKLRDAAKSLSRLYSPKSPRTSGEFDPSDSPRSRRNRLSLFGRNSSDKSDEELAAASRKCEELALEAWKLERRTQHVQKRLLEHTAGVLQMTHKGLKKNPKNNFPRTPESVYSGNTRGSVDGFDDRSLYKSLDNLDGFGGYDRGLNLTALQDTEKKLEMLSGRLRDMLLQTDPNVEPEPIPLSSKSNDSGPPTATVDAHLAYIENNLGMIGSLGASAPRSMEPGYNVEQQLGEVGSRLHNLMLRSGLSGSPTVPPPDLSSGLPEHLSYLSVSADSLERRIDGLLDQKSILTTQIQQQRELNSKSDSEKDAHTADLIEQLSNVRKELSLSERENQSSRNELDLVLEQLETVRRDLAAHEERQSKEDPNALATEQEARSRAERDILRLESELEQFQFKANTRAEESDAARTQAEGEVARLEGIIQQLHDGSDARAEEATKAREHAEKQVAELEAAMLQLRTESDNRVKEATDVHAQTANEIPRLQAELEQLGAQLKEAAEARSHAEEESSHKQKQLEERESEVAMAQTELTMARAELDGAYGSRAQRAAEVASNPAIQKEIDDLNTRNIALTEELAALKAGPGEGDLQKRMQLLEKELRETTDEYEAMTKASIEFEKDRERLDGVIDSLRERCERLETQISEDRISSMGVSSPSSAGRDGASETTSTMVLKNEFKKMMRDTRVENMKILKAEQEERRRLEALLRTLRKEHGKPSHATTTS